MSVAMRSDVNGLMATAAAAVAGTFLGSDDDGVDGKLGHDGVDDAGDDEALPLGPLTWLLLLLLLLLMLMLLLLALRSSG